MTENVLQKLLEGVPQDCSDPNFAPVFEIASKAVDLLKKINYQPISDTEKAAVLSEIFGQPLSDSVTIWTPFGTDFGRHIFLGNDVFINRDCMFQDLGRIYIEDRVLVASGCKILTVNHDERPSKRGIVCPKSVRIKQGAWLGAGATVLPGVTIGENSIIGAGAVVTKDIPDNVIAVGFPAKVIRPIKQ